MKYMGSKNKHSKELLPLILKDRNPDQWYVEPFVGGCNMIDKVRGNRLGSDSHSYLIALWQAVSENYQPPCNITEELYNAIRKNKEKYPACLVGYVGFSLSYAGKWFGGWRRDKLGKRNYVAEAYRNAIKQFPNLIGVRFVNKDYNKLTIPDNSIIYCDPPYYNTTTYKDKFDHSLFYTWCRLKHQDGHQIFVSEYTMPDDFICIWSKEVNNSLTKNTGIKKGVEKLFTLKRDETI